MLPGNDTASLRGIMEILTEMHLESNPCRPADAILTFRVMDADAIGPCHGPVAVFLWCDKGPELTVSNNIQVTSAKQHQQQQQQQQQQQHQHQQQQQQQEPSVRRI